MHRNWPGLKTMAVAAASLAVLASQPTALLAKGLLLTYSDKIGEKIRYKMSMEGSTTAIMGLQNRTANIKAEMLVSQEVVAAKDGVATVRTQVDGGSLNSDGQIMPLVAEGLQVLASIRKNGEIVQSSDFQGIDLKSLQVVFPDRELGLHDSWTQTVPATPQVPVRLTVTYRVVESKKLGEQECVRIQYACQSDKKPTADGVSLDLKSEGELYFAYKLGRILRNEVTSRSNVIRGGLDGSKDTRLVSRVSTHSKMEAMP